MLVSSRKGGCSEVGHASRVYRVFWKREISTIDVDDDEAIRKVEAATTVDPNAQQGVKNVEAITLTWTKTSLACAFAW